jgi:anaerobic dimethyl sulfoxide reductase subunit A
MEETSGQFVERLPVCTRLPLPSLKRPLSPEIRGRVSTIVKELIKRHENETIVYSSCTRCGGCFSRCSLKFRIKDGAITAIEPDDIGYFSGVAREDEAAKYMDLIKFRVLPRGCARKHAVRYQIYAHDRVLYPMKRTPDSKRGDFNGKFIRIPWEEAITLVAEKIKLFKEKYGPHSIMAPLHPRQEPMRLLSLYDCGVVGWGLSSEDSFRYSMKRTLGRKETDGHGPCSNAADILLNSKMIIGWGWAPSVSQDGNITAYYIKLARERGTPVIWIESRYTNDAECLADQWIPIRPGSDPAMIIAMAYVLFKEDLYDRDFITKYVNPSGFEKWKDYVLGVEDGVEKTPEWAEKITGVPAETIIELTRLIARNKPTFIKVGISIGRHSFGENVARTAYYLQCMYGHIGTPGAFSVFGIYEGPPIPARIELPSLGDWGTYLAPTTYRAHKWAQAILLAEKVKKSELSKAEYDSMVGNAHPDLPLPDYKMAIFEDNSTVSTCSNTSQCIEAIKKLEFVVVRAWHWNTTARVADLVIPAPEFYEEYLGPVTNTSGGPCSLGLLKQLVGRQDEIRPWEWFLTKVAEKLGFRDKFNKYYTTYGDDWTRMRKEQTKAAYENFKENMEAKGYKVPSWDEFEKHPYVIIDECRDNPFSYDWKADIAAGKLATPSKKIEFYSEWIATKDPMMPEDALDREKSIIGYPLPPIAKWIPPKRQFHDPEVDHEKYPLTMMSPHSRYRGHSCMGSNSLLVDEVYRHACWISVTDAKARGIKDGDLVRVYNDKGQMAVTEAYVTSRIVPGVVILHFGGWPKFNAYGVDEGATPNNLVWPLDKSPHYPANTKSCVQVEKLCERAM